MIDHAADFRSMAEFPVAWRWTSETHDLLPSATLADIHPLTEAAAGRIAREAVSRCTEGVNGEFTERFSTEGVDPDHVRARLGALGISDGTRVLVSWHAAIAVETSWQTFRHYWDAFCYPAADDVTVWAAGSGWSVCYRHFEMMQVRFPQPAI